MAHRGDRESVLAGRIAAGLADPITEEERRIVEGHREYYQRKFGPSRLERLLARWRSPRR